MVNEDIVKELYKMKYNLKGNNSLLGLVLRLVDWNGEPTEIYQTLVKNGYEKPFDKTAFLELLKGMNKNIMNNNQFDEDIKKLKKLAKKL